MDLENKIIQELQVLIDKSLFCADNTASALAYYSYLNKEDVISRMSNVTSCQKIVYELQKILKEKHDIDTQFLFLYSDPFAINFNHREFMFNLEYLKVVKRKKQNEINEFIEKNITILPRYDNVRFTHAMLEVLIGKEKCVIDPTCGIFYSFGKEDLLRGQGIYESLQRFKQIDFLKKSIQRGHFTLYYSTVKYWKSVYHVSYDLNGGLPIL